VEPADGRLAGPAAGRGLARSVCLIAAVGLLACRPASQDGPDAAPFAERSPLPEPGVSEADSDSLRLSIELPAEARVGEPVPIAFRVENISARPLDLYLRGRTIAFDLVVSGADGSIVWRRLEGEIIPAILRIETLAPGTALLLEHTWDQRTNAGNAAPPGEYTVRAELLTETEPLATSPGRLRIRSG
jgi:hypothetical protein